MTKKTTIAKKNLLPRTISLSQKMKSLDGATNYLDEARAQYPDHVVGSFSAYFYDTKWDAKKQKTVKNAKPYYQVSINMRSNTKDVMDEIID